MGEVKHQKWKGNKGKLRQTVFKAIKKEIFDGRTFEDDHIVDDLFSLKANDGDQNPHGPKKNDLHRGCDCFHIHDFTTLNKKIPECQS